MSASYSLYYWPISFRGHFIRSVLACNEASFDQPPVPELLKLKNADVSDPTTEAIFFAPPLLIDHELGIEISQMPAILTHLARKFGLVPDDIKMQVLAEKIVLDCNDVLSEITRGNGSKMWTKPEWESFVGPDGRFTKWLKVFEATAVRKGGLKAENGYLLSTPKPSIADFGVFALYGNMEHHLPKLKPLLREHAPTVMKLIDRLGEEKGLAGFFDKYNRDIYCGGQIEASIRSMLD